MSDLQLQTIYGIRVLMEMVVGILLFMVLFVHKLRVHLWVAVGIMAGWLVLIYISLQHTWTPTYFSGIWRMIHMALYIVFSFLAVRVAFKATVFQLIFVFFLTKNYLDDMTLFGKVLERLLWQGSGEYSIPLYLHIVFLLITLPFMLLFYIRFLRPIIDAREQHVYWRYLWVIPVSFYFIFSLGIYPGYSHVEIFEENGLIILPFAWSAGTFLSYYVVLQMLSETANSAALAEKLHISEILTHMKEEQYGLLRENIEETRRLRHDMRHHMLALEGYARSSDNEGLIGYIEQYLRAFGNEEGCVCDNPAVDAIVRFYLGSARGSNVQVTMNLKLPRDLPVPESDFCIVLGNLLENAAEACSRQQVGEKFIKITAGMAGEMVAISVKNSYEGEILHNQEEFLSRKHSGEGIGTASVRSIAERYRGMAKFEYGDGIFQASVLLSTALSNSIGSSPQPERI